MVTWFNRGTLHLVRSEDYPWLHTLTAPLNRTSSDTRLRQSGVSAAAAKRGMQLIEKSLADEGPLTSAALRERLTAGRVPTAGYAFGHLLFQASQRGLIVRGPMSGRQHCYVLVHDWLGPQPAVDRDAALAELARRYLAGHGPADDRDLARWTGLPLRDTRAGLNAIASELHQRADGLVDLARRKPAADIPPPRLLGAFDPVLLGWVSREPLLDVEQKIVTVGGMFYPFALVRGRAAALWTVRDGDGGDRSVRAHHEEGHGRARSRRARRRAVPGPGLADGHAAVAAGHRRGRLRPRRGRARASAAGGRRGTPAAGSCAAPCRAAAGTGPCCTGRP